VRKRGFIEQAYQAQVSAGGYCVQADLRCVNLLDVGQSKSDLVAVSGSIFEMHWVAFQIDGLQRLDRPQFPLNLVIHIIVESVVVCPKLLQVGQVRYILDSHKQVVGNVQCVQFELWGLGFSYLHHQTNANSRPYIVFQALQLFNGVMAHVQLLQVVQLVQSLNLGQSVALDAQ